MEQGAGGREVSGLDREIASTLLETGAVNFEAIGETIAKVGAKAMFRDDGWENFCGSDLRTYRWPRPHHGLEEVATLRDLTAEIRDLAAEIRASGIQQR